MAQMPREGNCSHRVKLETIPITESFPSTKSCKNFPMLVRVTAPRQCTERAGLDVVAVLDVSGSMNVENRLGSMKQAMEFVVNHLGGDDRLSIVCFNDQPEHLTELSVMSDANREAARTKINSLTASGGTDMAKALQWAAQGKHLTRVY